jgi:type I restriction-modification system DNA methylase subunit
MAGSPGQSKNCLPDDDYIKAGLVAKTALNTTEEKRFFHWELEFPEVFLAPSRPGGQDVQLRQDGGFDAVVGNPPYQVMENIDASQRTYFYSLKPDGTKIYEGAESKANIYSIFWEASLGQLTNNAHLGMITPYSWVSNSSFRALRSFLKSNATLRFVSAFDVGVFENVGIATGIFVIQNKIPTDDDKVRLLDARDIHVHNLEAILNTDSEMIQDVKTSKLWQEDEIVNLSYKEYSAS